VQIDEYLKRHKMKMAHLADHLDCHPQTIRAYIKQLRWPSYAMAKRIEEWTEGEVTVEDLMLTKPAKPRCECCGRLILAKQKPRDAPQKQQEETGRKKRSYAF